jgi:uncharacterized protein (DUF1330 family)
MAGYIIVDVEVTDPVRYQEYIRMVPGTLAKYGGRFLVRGGRAERLEGTWNPRRVVVLEFDSFERAKEWWASADYAPARALRQSTSKAEMILVQGV